jgi:hypothetical protein
MVPARLSLLCVAVLLASVANAAPITYRLTGDTNTTGAILDYGYLTTDGTVGEKVQLDLGTTLLDYEIRMLLGAQSTTLTPGNTQILGNAVKFTITTDSITLTETSSPFSGNDAITFSEIGAGNSFTISHYYGAVHAASVTAHLQSGTINGLVSLPFVVATAIPEPSTLALAAMLAGSGMMRCRSNLPFPTLPRSC